MLPRTSPDAKLESRFINVKAIPGLGAWPFPGYQLINQCGYVVLYPDTEFAQAVFLRQAHSYQHAWAPQELRDELGLRERDLCCVEQNSNVPKVWVQSGRLYVVGEARWLKVILRRWHACEAEYPEPLLSENLKTLEVSVPKTEYQPPVAPFPALVPTQEKHVTKIAHPILVRNPQPGAPEPAKVRMVVRPRDWKSILWRKRPQIPGFFLLEGGNGSYDNRELNVGIYTHPAPGFVNFLFPGRYYVRVYHLDADDRILAWGEEVVEAERGKRPVGYANYMLYGFPTSRTGVSPYPNVLPPVGRANWPGMTAELPRPLRRVFENATDAPYTCRRPVFAEDDFQKINPNLVMLNEVTLKTVEAGTRELAAVEGNTPFFYHMLDRKTGDTVGVRVVYAPNPQQAVQLMTCGMSAMPTMANTHSSHCIPVQVGEFGMRRGDERFGRSGCIFVRGCTVFHVAGTFSVEQEHAFARSLDGLYVELARKLNPDQEIATFDLVPEKVPVTELFPNQFILRQEKWRVTFSYEYTRDLENLNYSPEEPGVLLTGTQVPYAGFALRLSTNAQLLPDCP